jgi:hypothetical protein
VTVALRDSPPIADFDYNAEAELFPTRKRAARRQPMQYRRFARAKEAIRFAIEELPSDLLIGAYLEVEEHRYNGEQIRKLYESDSYPLKRLAVRAVKQA